MSKWIAVAASLFVLITTSVSFAGSEEGDLSEAVIRSYLEKNAVGDTGMCLVDEIKIDIKGISDVVPGHQVEVFYYFEYKLRCSNSRKSDKGGGLLRAAKLRTGVWIDRHTFKVIGK